jgi:8-oxo-dGTP pyrophosphatase MutT (NUDIX family)
MAIFLAKTMQRQQIIRLLDQYQPENTAELVFKQKLKLFIENEPNCLLREHLVGHVTGSAFVINHLRNKTLQVHHAKLGRWLQPGGHADGHSNIAAVALKEAQEETGLTQLQVLDSQIFDIDIHTIPERRGVPEHLHYDIRFLVIANDSEPLAPNHESTDIRWIPTAHIETYSTEASILRMAQKLKTHL